MSLSKMPPPEVLSSILNNRAMSLKNRLRLRGVSTRWSDVIEDGLAKESSLCIRDFNYYFEPWKPKPGDLVLVLTSDNITDKFLALLGRLFPTPTKLSLYINEMGDRSLWSKVPSLLTHLATNLKTFQLNGLTLSSEPVEAIAGTLNGIQTITYLGLHTTFCFNEFFPHLGPLLPRLEKLAFTDLNGDISVSPMPRCTHLMLPYDDFASLNDAYRRQLSISVKHLHLTRCNCGKKTNWKSLSYFHGLPNLTLYFHVQSNYCNTHFSYTSLDSSLLGSLSSLIGDTFTRLTDFKLLHLDYPSPLEYPSEKAKVFSATKRLTLLIIFPKSSADFDHFFKAIQFWFPSVERLTLFCDPGFHPAIQDSLAKIPFSVKILDKKLGRDSSW